MHAKKIILGILGVIIIGIIIFFVTQQRVKAPESNPEQQPTTSTPTIVIENYSFSPNVLSVKKGTTVVWTNNDAAPHAIVGNRSSWMVGPTLKQWATYTHTFDANGTFNYSCAIHPSMRGTIIVTE